MATIICVQVKGAGSPKACGEYKIVPEKSYCDCPYYLNESSGLVVCKVQNDGEVGWIIGDMRTKEAYYGSQCDSNIPPTTHWQVLSEGSYPVPNIKVEGAEDIADRLKKQANLLMQKDFFQEASKLYSDALKLLSDKLNSYSYNVLLSNRAEAQLRMNKFEECVRDCGLCNFTERSLLQDKTLIRASKALLSLNRVDEAIQTAEKCEGDYHQFLEDLHFVKTQQGSEIESVNIDLQQALNGQTSSPYLSLLIEARVLEMIELIESSETARRYITIMGVPEKLAKRLVEAPLALKQLICRALSSPSMAVLVARPFISSYQSWREGTVGFNVVTGLLKGSKAERILTENRVACISIVSDLFTSLSERSESPNPETVLLGEQISHLVSLPIVKTILNASIANFTLTATSQQQELWISLVGACDMYNLEAVVDFINSELEKEEKLIDFELGEYGKILKFYYLGEYKETGLIVKILNCIKEKKPKNLESNKWIELLSLLHAPIYICKPVLWILLGLMETHSSVCKISAEIEIFRTLLLLKFPVSQPVKSFLPEHQDDPDLPRVLLKIVAFCCNYQIKIVQNLQEAQQVIAFISKNIKYLDNLQSEVSSILTLVTETQPDVKIDFTVFTNFLLLGGKTPHLQSLVQGYILNQPRNLKLFKSYIIRNYDESKWQHFIETFH